MPASTAGDLAGRDNSQSNSLADLAARIHAELLSFRKQWKRRAANTIKENPATVYQTAPGD
jgi:hypothetical protein